MTELDRELARSAASFFAPAAPRLVFGEGPVHARVMLIGEAPGESEEREGRPFVGKAGKNLNDMLELIRLDRGELYVTNTVKLRPSRVSPAGNLVNRPPTGKEVAFFLPFLLREIALVSPDCIVTLGNTPLRALMGKNAVIGDMHGRFISRECSLLYPMYHPASLIYNRSLTATYEEDMRRLAEWLAANH